jgi:hypothetical protein
MKLVLFSLVMALGWISKLNAQFINLDFESAAIPSHIPPSGVPPNEVMPGWTVSCTVYVDEWLPRGPYISVIRPNHGFLSWTGQQGDYFITMKSGSVVFGGGPAFIAQTGYLSPTTKSLHFRAEPLANLLVSFAGETLPCVVVSSNGECAADISKFAGSTGELKFMSSETIGVYLDFIWFSNQAVSNSPPTAPVIAFSKPGDSKVRLTFPVQPGTTCFVQASTNLVDWETVKSFQTSNNPSEFVDDLARGSNVRYYRVVVPP